MIRRPQVLRDYVKANPLIQVRFGDNVITGLTNNPGPFPSDTLPVSLADLTAATNLLSTKYNDYKELGHGRKEAFLAAQLAWVKKFDLIADYVDLIARSAGPDAGTVIQLASYHISKTKTEPAVLPVGPDGRIESATKGTVNCSAERVKDAKGYLFAVGTPDMQVEKVGNQITVKVGNSFISFIISIKREATFTNVPSHIDVKGGVAAFNSAGLSAFDTHTDIFVR